VTLTITTTSPAPRAAEAASTSPADRLMRVAGVVGPLVLLASSLVWIGGDDLAEARGILTFWALPFLALAAYGLAERLDGEAPRGRAVVTALVAIGACAGAGFATEVNMVDHFGIERLMEQDTPSAFLALGLPGLCLPLSLAVLGLLSLRHRTLPRAQALLLTAGGLLFPLGRIPQVAPLAVVTDLLIVGALAPLAWQARPRAGAAA